MSADLSCPVCGTELDLAVLFAHEGDQRALARLAAVSIPLGGRVLQYLGLFTPPKQRLTAAKKIKLILQLLPDLERGAISWKGRDWAAPRTAWAMAIDQMLAARDAQRLEQGNNALAARIAAGPAWPGIDQQGVLGGLQQEAAALANVQGEQGKLPRLWARGLPQQQGQHQT